MATESKAYPYDWKALIKEQQMSDKNMKKFCLEKGLPYQSFRNHKYSLDSASYTAQTFILVKVAEFKEVEFSLNGNILRFDSSLDHEFVAMILRTLIS